MLGILHLSDIHIKSSEDEILYLDKELKKVFQNEFQDVNKVIILITGDIANRGIADEFYLAEVLLLEKIKGLIDVESEIICVPGNHDCNLNPNLDENILRTDFINSFLEKKDSVKDPLINICCKAQSEYIKFEKKVTSKNFQNIFNDKLLKIDKLVLDNKENLYFIRINTAWISQLREEPGKLYFPISNYTNELEKIDDGIVITLFHHPSRWCHPDDAHSFDLEVEAFSNFIFCGHEHSQDTYKKTGNHSNVVYFFGEALQKDDIIYKSGFQILKFDFLNKEYKINKYELINGSYNICETQEWTSFEEIIRRKNNIIKLSEDMNTFLNDLGMNLNHPQKEELKFQDIFVYPDLEIKEVKDNNTKIKNDYVSSKVLIKKDFNKPVLVFADDNFGKTSLAKKLFMDFYDDQKIPIYIDIEKINKSKFYDLNRLIEYEFKKEYKVKEDIKFLDLDKDERVIIVDNLDKLQGKSKQKIDLIKNLFKLSAKIICFSKTMIEIEEIFLKNQKQKYGFDIVEYEIKKFGHNLRYKLIEKWNSIGSPIAQHKDEFIISNEDKQRKIDLIIGKNYIPSIPFYILVILQSTEMGNVHNLKDSSFGYYYQYLILQTLNKISKDTGIIDAINSFMINLSFQIKNNENKHISNEDLFKFHKKFREDLRISKESEMIYDYNLFITQLCFNNILVKVGENYKFCYNYIYYYYIARYYSNRIYEESIREEIQMMIDKLYIEEYANIILFLVYMDKSSFIFDKLIDVSNNIFKENKCVQLTNDINFINELQTEILPKLIIDQDKKPVEERAKQLRARDEAERRYEEEKQKIKDEKVEEETMETMKQLNLGFKSMEIAGQILKNYWGSLNGDEKEKIGVSLYSVGLRSLNEIFKTLNEAKDSLSELIKEEIKDKNSNNKDIMKFERQAKKMIIMFATYFTQGTIFKIVECIGDRNLERTYEDILNQMPYNSVELINLRIKLQFPNGTFPTREVKSLLEKNKNNPIVEYLIKKSVIQYVYMYKQKRAEIQKIATLIKVPIKNFTLMKLKDDEKKKEK